MNHFTLRHLIGKGGMGTVYAADSVVFGHVVSTRVGLGVQGTSYDSSFTTGGGATMDGPGEAFEIDGVWSVGGSFDARIGEKWTFGAGSTLSVAFKTDARALEAGVQLGYRWTQ